MMFYGLGGNVLQAFEAEQAALRCLALPRAAVCQAPPLCPWLLSSDARDGFGGSLQLAEGC